MDVIKTDFAAQQPFASRLLQMGQAGLIDIDPKMKAELEKMRDSTGDTAR